VVVTVLGLASAGLAVEITYKPNVPDVDKQGVPPQPNPGDNSCWQATAANLLGGAGYGTGGDPQARADSIYATLTADLGTGNLGQTARAINYWLHMYGKNPASAEYQPDNTYTDVTDFSGLVTANDYDFLLDELVRCQYVAVSFDQPAHTMTLVGGIKESILPGGSFSLWHDSDRDVGSPAPGTPDDDKYNNDFITNGRWDLPGYPMFFANGYTTLCPGLNKPEDAVRNYDVAYFRQGQTLATPDFRVAGEFADGGQDDFDAPYWLQESSIVHIDNEFIPGQYKEVWLLVDYIDRVPDRALQETILLRDCALCEYEPTSVTASKDDGQLLFYWELPHQPDWEEIIFPDARYVNLTGDVKDWNLATICLPEPTTIALLGMGGLTLLKYRRKRSV